MTYDTETEAKLALALMGLIRAIERAPVITPAMCKALEGAKRNLLAISEPTPKGAA